MAYKLKTAPESEALTLAEVLAHLNESSDGSTNDDLVNRLITASRKFVEKYTSRQLMEATWYLYLDDFPGQDYDGKTTIKLQRSPVTAVGYVKYYDDDNVLRTLTNETDYFLDLDSEPARIRIENIPSVYDKPNAVVIEFTAGYESADDVPETIKSAMLLLIGHLFENRQEEITGAIVSKLGKGFEYLLQFDDVTTY